jgi:TonB-dependent SusC/RagA subfamily outer membrane receptor
MRVKIALFILLALINVTVSSGQKNKKVIISGIVSDTLQKPLVGALVLVDGKRTNSYTNNDGVFRIKVRSDADSISIFAAGNRLQTLPIMGRSRIDFIFNESDPVLAIDNMEELPGDKQVDVGYGTVSQKDLLTPVSTIDGRGNKYAAYRDIYEILKGTPGVIVRGNSVQIDGPGSMFSSTEPLFVIDGMTVGTIDGITPVMVESISVLKGSSTAIYGSRGANGVILITLYKGPEKSKNRKTVK